MKINNILKFAVAGVVAIQPILTGEKSLAQSIEPPASFQCLTQSGYYVTLAVRKNGVLSDPIIVWKTEEFSEAGYTPERRCSEVTSRLNKLLSQNNGTLKGLYLTVGPVNGQQVLCAVNNTRTGCNTNNMLFTLSERNRQNPTKILESLSNVSAGSVSGTLVQESGGQPYVNLEKLVDGLFK